MSREDKFIRCPLFNYICEPNKCNLKEHDKQIRAEVIKKVKKSVKNALNSYNPSYMDIYNVISELSDVVIGRIEIFEEQMQKGADNEI